MIELPKESNKIGRIGQFGCNQNCIPFSDLAENQSSSYYELEHILLPQENEQKNTVSENNQGHNIRANQYACCVDPRTIRTEEFNFCKNKILELQLSMRLIQTSYIEEDKRLVFFFTAPERVDFRDLLRVLRQQYFGIRIELRQIGQRDAASLLGGVGICGRELCCCSFLRSFFPITAKIAKKVGPTPNPAMYCGVCGRLRCCLRYEENEEGIEDIPNQDTTAWEQYED